jgi:hypothetical protein
VSAPASADERRGHYFNEFIRGRVAVWSLVIGIAVSVLVGGSMQDVRVTAGGIAVTALLIVLFAYSTASKRAKDDFFAALAPTLGLTYMVTGGYVPITPLLAAGDRRRFDHTMEGPLYGRAGGPPCLLAHYTYEVRREARVGMHDDETVTAWTPHHFTVCAIELGPPLARFRGLYLRPRLSGLGLQHDWLDRAPKPRAVELESERFNEIYDLRMGIDQDEIAVRELFSPSFVMWLADHPLQPGFECKAGTLAVFLRGHEGSGGKLAFFHEASREIARRLTKQVEQGGTAPLAVTARQF